MVVDKKYLTPQSRSLAELQGNGSDIMDDAYHVKTVSNRVVNVEPSIDTFKHNYPFPRRERQFLPRGVQN